MENKATSKLLFCNEFGLRFILKAMIWDKGMHFRPFLRPKSVSCTLRQRFPRFSSLKGVAEHSWAARKRGGGPVGTLPLCESVSEYCHSGYVVIKFLTMGAKG